MSVKAGGLARYQLTRKAYENVHEGRGQWYSLRQPRYRYSPWVASCHRRVHIRALVKCMSQVEKTPSGFLHLERRPKKTKKKCRVVSEPGQDSPFWTLETGGCIKSLKGPRASFRAELTSDDEHVIHSTSVGYRAITWAHVLPSTAGSKWENIRKGGKKEGNMSCE